MCVSCRYSQRRKGEELRTSARGGRTEGPSRKRRDIRGSGKEGFPSPCPPSALGLPPVWDITFPETSRGCPEPGRSHSFPWPLLWDTEFQTLSLPVPLLGAPRACIWSTGIFAHLEIQGYSRSSPHQKRETTFELENLLKSLTT